jgi:hypothetical protein
MNGEAVEQVEKAKLLGVTLDCKLSWSKHIDSMVVKMGRGLSVIKRCSAFLTPHSKKQVLQALVLSYLDYCPVVWSSAARKDLVKLQLTQNRAARLALHCNQRADINTMHTSLSWLRVEERLTASLLFLNCKKLLTFPLPTDECLLHILAISIAAPIGIVIDGLAVVKYHNTKCRTRKRDNSKIN